jgi:hypothetical protein
MIIGIYYHSDRQNNAIKWLFRNGADKKESFFNEDQEQGGLMSLLKKTAENIAQPISLSR